MIGDGIWAGALGGFFLGVVLTGVVFSSPVIFASDLESARREIPECEAWAPRTFLVMVPDKEALNDYHAVFIERGWANMTTERAWDVFNMTGTCHASGRATQ